MVSQGEITTVSNATSRSKSLRTTIPAGIVRQFKLVESSKLNWKIEARDSELVIIVTPVRNNTKFESRSRRLKK